MGRSGGSRIALIAALVGLVAAALVPATQAAKTSNVFINGDTASNYKFTPRKLEIKRKGKVKWEWDSNGAHNVRFPKLNKESITGASETYKLSFKKKGKFNYLCTVHGFRGTILVK